MIRGKTHIILNFQALILFLLFSLYATYGAGQSIVCTKPAKKYKADTLGTAAFEKQKGLLKIPAESYLSIDTANGPPYMSCGLGWEEAFDITCIQKTTARAVAAGMVTKIVQVDSTWLVIVRHGEYKSVYNHLGTVHVRESQTLAAGEPIGQIATTGDRTYLAFQLWKGTRKLSPKNWFLYTSEQTR